MTRRATGESVTPRAILEEGVRIIAILFVITGIASVLLFVIARGIQLSGE